MPNSPPYHKKLTALTLNNFPIREKDCLVEIYSRQEGRIKVFAPGIRHVFSRRAGHLQPLLESRLDIMVYPKGQTVKEAKTIKSFMGIRDNFDNLEKAFEIAQLLRTYTPGGRQDKALYDSVLAVLEAVNSGNPSSTKLAVDVVKTHLLYSLGSLPDLYNCTVCRKKLEPDNFSLQKSSEGFRCIECGGGKDFVLTEVVKIMRFFLQNPGMAEKVKASPQAMVKLRRLTSALLNMTVNLRENKKGVGR